MKEIEDLSNEELIERYEAVCEFRALEKSQGQVTPHEIKEKRLLEQEIFDRMR